MLTIDTELLSKYSQLKMRSLDGKKYTTDAADTETLLCIVQSIPSPKAEPFKQWLAKVGTERIEEIAQEDLLAGMTPAQRVLLYDEEMEVVATIQYDKDHAFWLAAPDWSTRKDFDPAQ